MRPTLMIVSEIHVRGYCECDIICKLHVSENNLLKASRNVPVFIINITDSVPVFIISISDPVPVFIINISDPVPVFIINISDPVPDFMIFI